MTRSTPTLSDAGERNYPTRAGRNLSNQVEQYRVTADGQRFLVKVPVDSSPEANAIHVIVNWPALLER